MIMIVNANVIRFVQAVFELRLLIEDKCFYQVHKDKKTNAGSASSAI